MYKQPLFCVAALNRLIHNRQKSLLERANFLIIDGEENELQVLQSLLYLCKAVWLIDHEDCEMIPEYFEITWTGPQIAGVQEVFPGYRWQKRWPKYYMESRPLTQEECDLIDKVSFVCSKMHSQFALFHYFDNKKELYSQTKSNGLRTITTNNMRLWLSNPKNRQMLVHFALWGFREKEGIEKWANSWQPF